MKSQLKFTLLLIGVFILLILEVSTGSVLIELREIQYALLGNEIESGRSFIKTIIIDSRLPRVMTAILAGAGLSVSGLILQTLFRNPLAGPGVLGISSGAGLGVAIVLLAGGSLGAMPILIGHPAILGLAAMLGALAVMLIVLMAATKLKDSVSLLIVGLMIGYLSSGMITVLEYGANEEAIKSLVFWGMGSFSSATWEQIFYLAITVLPSIVLIVFLSKSFNALLLGEEEAATLGVNYKSLKLAIIVVSSVITGMVTAACGPIAFLGLAVPHLARSWFRSANHKILIPSTLCLGIFLALLCDLLSRMPWTDHSLPLNAITSFIGAPIVLSIILRTNKLKSYY